MKAEDRYSIVASHYYFDTITRFLEDCCVQWFTQLAVTCSFTQCVSRSTQRSEHIRETNIIHPKVIGQQPDIGLEAVYGTLQM